MARARQEWRCGEARSGPRYCLPARGVSTSARRTKRSPPSARARGALEPAGRRASTSRNSAPGPRPGLVSPDLQSNLSSLEHSDARFTLDGRAHSPPGASIGSGSWILGWWRRVRQTWGQRIKPPFPFMICDPGPVENPGFCPDRHTAVAPRTCSLHIPPTLHPSALRNFSTPASNSLSPQVPDNMGPPLKDPTRDHQPALQKRPTSSQCGCCGKTRCAPTGTVARGDSFFLSDRAPGLLLAR